MYYAQRFAAAIACIAMLGAAWLSLQWARADAAFRTQTPEGLQQAVAIAPSHRLYATAAAIQAEYDGVDASTALMRLAERHPRAGAPRLQLGLAAEIRGDNAAAERWLLEAYAVDKMFETRWTLANFYFRQGREDDFWVWMKRALEISYGDRRPAFDLCWRASTDGTLILERGLPDRAEVLAAYLWYLLESRHSDSLATAARRLAALGPNDTGPLNAAVDALLTSRRFGDAALVWQALGHPTPAGVTNGDFARPPLDTGFDWRRARSEGVTHVPLDAGRGYRIRLTGNQPEECELLRQWLGGLQLGKRYRLRWDAAEAVRGVRWRIAGATAEIGSGELAFTATDEAMPLFLLYARPAGEVRAQATIDLARVWLE